MKLLALTAIATLAVGCRTPGAAAPALANTAASIAAPADRFAGLFAGDRALTYQVTTERSHWDDQDPAANANGNVTETSTVPLTCHATVGRAGRWRRVVLACDRGEDVPDQVLELLESTFVSDGSGLWRNPDVDVADAAALDAAEGAPDLPAQPVPVEQRDEEDERFGTSHLVVAEGDGWCVQDNSWGGDESGSAWCVGPRGLVKAMVYFDGGASFSQTAVLE